LADQVKDKKILSPSVALEDDPMMGQGDQKAD
jgi:hypothetical protein